MNLPNAIEVKLNEYRRRRHEETGKRPFRDTAIAELLAKALDGIEPAKPVTERLADIERRLSELESR